MLNIGVPELLILTVVIGGSLLLLLPLWAVVDAAKRPDSAFRSAGQNKTLWVLLSAAGFVVPFLGWVLPVVYLVVIRPQVRSADGSTA